VTCGAGRAGQGWGRVVEQRLCQQASVTQLWKFAFLPGDRSGDFAGGMGAGGGIDAAWVGEYEARVSMGMFGQGCGEHGGGGVVLIVDFGGGFSWIRPLDPPGVLDEASFEGDGVARNRASRAGQSNPSRCKSLIENSSGPGEAARHDDDH